MPGVETKASSISGVISPSERTALVPVEAGKAENPGTAREGKGAGRVETIDPIVKVCPCLSESTALVPGVETYLLA